LLFLDKLLLIAPDRLDRIKLMGTYGGFYKGEKKKKKREFLEKEAERIRKVFTPPRIEIIGKKGKK